MPYDNIKSHKKPGFYPPVLGLKMSLRNSDKICNSVFLRVSCFICGRF